MIAILHKLYWWLRNVFHRLTYRKTISSVRFIVPPGYPDDMYELSVTVEDGIIKIGGNPN